MRSSNPLSIALVVVFVAGAMLFVIGTMLTRARRQPAPQPDATPSQPSLEVRIDMVERLAMVGQPWCIEQLNQIRDNDSDESVREAADAALLVIGSRPPATP